MSQKVTKAEALADIQRVAEELGRPPKRDEYREHGEYSAVTAAKHFDGSFTAARAAALDIADARQAEHSRADLLDDIEAVAETVDGEPSKDDYKDHGEYALSTITYRFESWVGAKQEAGVYDGLDAGPTREELLADLQRVDDEIDGAVSQTVYNEHGEWTDRAVKLRFDSWETACQEAGVTRPTKGPRTEATEALLDDIRQLADELGRPPTKAEYNEAGKFTQQMAKSRLGSWNDAVQEAGFDPRKQGSEPGELSNNWKGGHEPYYGPRWPRKRREARERDGYACVVCGITDAEHIDEYGWELEVHHIKPVRTFEEPDNANDLDNLITLCRPHHREYEQLPNERAKEKLASE